jgi:hypothetical protein
MFCSLTRLLMSTTGCAVQSNVGDPWLVGTYFVDAALEPSVHFSLSFEKSDAYHQPDRAPAATVLLETGSQPVGINV